MTGEYMHTLDAKGRLAVPSRLRDELGGIFYVTLSMDRCLSAYSAESWQRFSDKVDAMPFVKQRRMRPLFAFAARCEADAQGRILLPQNLRDYADDGHEGRDHRRLQQPCGALGPRALERDPRCGNDAGEHCRRHGRAGVLICRNTKACFCTNALKI